MSLINVAREYIMAGLSVLPVHRDKRPTIATWKDFQQRKPVEAELAAFNSAFGIAVVGGAVSGNLVCIDIDVKHDVQKTISREYFDFVKEIGFENALKRAVIEKTPSGGFHVLFRAPFVHGCEKVARDHGKPEAMIETKGEGGYFVCAPTMGWELVSGRIQEIPTFTAEEANAFLSAAWGLDRNESPAPAPVERIHHEGKSPFDDYHDRATADDMLAVLEGHGWRKVGQRGENWLLVRPGKQGREYGATLHQSKRVFFVHTSSSEFHQGRGYSAVGVYCVLNHGGDFKACAKDLLSKGYGERRGPQKLGQQKQAAPESVEPRQKLLLQMGELDAEVSEAFRRGPDRGIETEWPGFEYRIAENQLTVVTGYPSSGKSSFIQSVAVHLAKAHNWRIVIASIEDYPNRRLAGKLIRKYARRSMYGREPMNFEEYQAAWNWVKEHFVFVNAAADEITLSRILDETAELNAVNKINGLILDPWSELDEDRPADMTETDFIKVSLKRARKFARAQNIHVWILAHPTKPRRDKEGRFQDVDLYDIAGSHHWRAKADNGFVVKRDLQSNVTTVQIQKVKFSDYGKIGEVKAFNFDVPTECYSLVSKGQDFLGHQEQPQQELEYSGSLPWGDR